MAKVLDENGARRLAGNIITQIPTKVSDLPNDADYITTTEAENRFSALAQYNTPDGLMTTKPGLFEAEATYFFNSSMYERSRSYMFMEVKGANGSAFSLPVISDDYLSSDYIKEASTTAYGVVKLTNTVNSSNMVVTSRAVNTALQSIEARIPTAPTTDGIYVLRATVTNGTPSYTWVLEG